MKESMRVLAALVLAIAGGMLIGWSRSPALLAATDSLTPVGTLWVNAIRMTVIPLVVSLIITGVASATTATTIGRMGARVLVVCLAMLIGTAILVIPVA